MTTKNTVESRVNDFPVEALPESVRTFVEQASESIVCPPELVALPLLVMFGSAIGNSRVIQLKRGWSEGPTLYAASVAEPGEKKSPAASEATRPARKVQSKFRREYEQESKRHERMGGDAGDAGDTVYKEIHGVAEPVMKRTYVDDTTVEALAVVLKDNQRGVMVDKDELTAWVKSMDQYKQGKGSDRQFWLSAWSGRGHTVDRKGQKEAITLDRLSLCVYGGIQPDVLHELKAQREDGLLDRFLFAYPEPITSRWSDSEISEQAEQDLRSAYVKLRGLHMDEDEYGDPNPTPVHFEQGAKQVFIQLVNEHREEMELVEFPRRLRGPWSKFEAYLARLALILSLLRSTTEHEPEQVIPDDVLRASVLLDYFKGQTRKVYGEMYSEDRLDLLAKDVARFVGAMGGQVKDTPTSIYYSILSEHKPQREDEFTKDLKNIAKRTPALGVEQGHIGRGKDKKRALVITLINGVPGVPGVPTAPITEHEAAKGWGKAARYFNLTGNYVEGRADWAETVETATRLVLYGLDRPGDDWHRHTGPVERMLEKLVDEARSRAA